MLAAFVLAWMSVPAAAPLPGSCTPLQVAVMSADEPTVKRLAGRRLLGVTAPEAKLEERSEQNGPCLGRTALMLAAEYGQVAIAKLLIISGANLNATAVMPELGEGEINARCLAIANGRAAIVTLLDQAGAAPMPCTQNAALFAAVTTASPDLVARELRAHPSPGTLTAVLKSVVGKSPGKAVDLVIEAGLESKLDFEPVYEAAINANDIAYVVQLSAAGAKVKDGEALSQALTGRRAKMITPLLAAGARPEQSRAEVLIAVRLKEGVMLTPLLRGGYRGDENTPLLLTAIRSFPEIVAAMVKAGVGVEVDDEAGVTPLMAAAEMANVPAAQLLLERGASPRTGDINCKTAWDVMRGSKLPNRIFLEPVLRPLDAPVVPGRAARRVGVTCGTARITLHHRENLEVFLPTAVLPMQPEMQHRVDPGTYELRVRHIPTGSERKLTVTLKAGENTFDERFLDFTKRP